MIRIVVQAGAARDSSVQSVTENNVDLFLKTKICEPVPRKGTLASDDEVVTEWPNCLQKTLWIGSIIVVQQFLANVVLHGEITWSECAGRRHVNDGAIESRTSSWTPFGNRWFSSPSHVGPLSPNNTFGTEPPYPREAMMSIKPLHLTGRAVTV